MPQQMIWFFGSEQESVKALVLRGFLRRAYLVPSTP